MSLSTQDNGYCDGVLTTSHPKTLLVEKNVHSNFKQAHTSLYLRSQRVSTYRTVAAADLVHGTTSPSFLYQK